MKREEAMEIVKKLYNNSLFLKKDKEALETLIPELVESEDEKIRKELLYYLNERSIIETPTDTSCKQEWIAWLEKQKDINALIQDASEKAYTEGMRVERKYWLEKQGEQNPTKVEPKFKVGDLIKEKRDKYGDSIIKIEGIDSENYYYFDKEFPIKISEQDNWELVEQKSIDKIEPKFKVGENMPILEKVEKTYDPTIPFVYTDLYTSKLYVEMDGYRICVDDLFNKLPKEQ